MTSDARGATQEQVEKAVETLRGVARSARVFVSMPVIEDVTPAALLNDKNAEDVETDEPLPRRHGFFPLKDAPLSVLDHLALYGDGCFEGVRISHGHVFMWREHMWRMIRSARMLNIDIPYSELDLTEAILRACREADPGLADNGYIRLVVSRGMGDLGINPAKCIAPTVFAIVSSIAVYPKEAYETGVAIGLSRHVRRPSASTLNPTIKSCNYVNNVLGLLEGVRGEQMEAIMLTERGFIAEATVDNMFLVERRPGWEDDPTNVKVWTPRAEYCLNGITRALVIKLMRDQGYQVDEHADLVPIDLVGPNRECFMTGTGAGVMPVVEVCGVPVGDRKPGKITAATVAAIDGMMADPKLGLSMNATADDTAAYFAADGPLPEARGWLQS